MYFSRATHTIKQRQRGVVFIIMLVILIMGVAAILVTSLSKVALQTERDRQSSDILAQAKEVVIGYALNNTSGSQYPGELLYPDVLSETPPNYDGNTEGGCLNALQPNGLPPISSGANMRCLGRLPWKVFSMPIASPSENDPTGFMPWYAISANMVDTPLPFHFNSELLNSAPHPWLTVHDMKGNILSNRVAFIIFIPGAALPGQSRPPAPLGGANQYLDNITVPNGCTPPCVPGTYTNFDMDDDFIMGDEHRWIDDPANPGKQIEDSGYHFNDKLLYITIDDLMPLIEKRIAREAKACLDNYAAQTNNNGKYPWAVPISDTSNYLSADNTRFGRLAASPNVFNNNPNVLAMTDALSQLQTALNNYVANNTSATRSALRNKGNLLGNLGDSPQAPVTSTIGNIAKDTGDAAQNLGQTPPQDTVSNVQTGIYDTMSAMATAGFVASDTTMSLTWPSSCTLFSSVYWGDWRDLVFYQIANGNQPGASPNCTGSNCLSIASTSPLPGNGNFRATVVVSGKMLPTQVRATTTDKQNLGNYLEGLNSAGKANPPTSTSFESYKTSDSNYMNITNDLVLCLDGKNLCQ